MSSLFRSEAISKQTRRLHGEVSLAQPITLSWLVLCLVLGVGSLVGYLCLAEYTRKETVRGVLVPSKGLLQSYAGQSGVVSRLHVGEGQVVVAGAALLSIAVKHSNQRGEDLGESVLAELDARIQLVDRALVEREKWQSSEKVRLLGLVTNLKLVLEGTLRQQALIKEKLALQTGLFEQQQALAQNGHLARITLSLAREKWLNLATEVEQLKVQVLALKKEEQQLLSALNRLPHESALTLNQLAQQRSELLQQKQEAETSFEFVVRAREDAVVTAIQVHEGQEVAASQALFALIPAGSELLVELQLPTRAAGFVKPGQVARVRFDAFPYQRFGFVNGSITEVDKAILLQNPLFQNPGFTQEPSYRVRARLARQSVLARGEAFPLRAGMLLEADIVLERRNLLTWLLDPILDLRGRLG